MRGHRRTKGRRKAFLDREHRKADPPAALCVGSHMGQRGEFPLSKKHRDEHVNRALERLEPHGHGAAR